MPLRLFRDPVFSVVTVAPLLATCSFFVVAVFMPFSCRGIIEATSGHIVVAPAGAPHRFVNSGARRARHIDIHTSRRMATARLEDQENGNGGIAS